MKLTERITEYLFGKPITADVRAIIDELKGLPPDQWLAISRSIDLIEGSISVKGYTYSKDGVTYQVLDETPSPLAVILGEQQECALSIERPAKEPFVLRDSLGEVTDLYHTIDEKVRAYEGQQRTR